MILEADEFFESAELDIHRHPDVRPTREARTRYPQRKITKLVKKIWTSLLIFTTEKNIKLLDEIMIVRNGGTQDKEHVWTDRQSHEYETI